LIVYKLVVLQIFLLVLTNWERIDTSVTQELFVARHRDRIVLSFLVNMCKRQKSNVLLSPMMGSIMFVSHATLIKPCDSMLAVYQS